MPRARYFPRRAASCSLVPSAPGTRAAETTAQDATRRRRRRTRHNRRPPLARTVRRYVPPPPASEVKAEPVHDHHDGEDEAEEARLVAQLEAAEVRRQELLRKREDVFHLSMRARKRDMARGATSASDPNRGRRGGGREQRACARRERGYTNGFPAVQVIAQASRADAQLITRAASADRGGARGIHCRVHPGARMLSSPRDARRRHDGTTTRDGRQVTRMTCGATPLSHCSLAADWDARVTTRHHQLPPLAESALLLRLQPAPHATPPPTARAVPSSLMRPRL